MAKAILEFDLTDPDDNIEFQRATKALDMSLSIWEFAHNTKKKLLWEVESKEGSTDAEYAAIERVYEKFWEILEEHSISPDKLVI